MNRDKNIWLSLGFMSAHKVMQFKLIGHYQSKNGGFELFKFKNVVGWILRFPTRPNIHKFNPRKQRLQP